MNDTAAALGNQTNSVFSNTSPGVIVLLVLVALLAAVTVVGLIYGAHQKRRRKQAEIEVEEHAEDERGATGDRPSEPAPLHERDTPPPPVPTAPPAPPVDEPPAAPTPLIDEPVAATDAATANPAVEAATGGSEAAAPGMAGQPVTTVKGLGPKVATRLGELGIATVGDLAALDDRAAQDLDARLGAFTGRMTRDRWLEQARLLAAGDRKTFEERFGKL